MKRPSKRLFEIFTKKALSDSLIIKKQRVYQEGRGPWGSI
ncbi:hypothetical protein SRABI96_03072 [Peribacillus sp. Bi96]|nr:hypothetical protein SRABI96_03072 [Peribacillus sp. Bi96]